MASFAKPRNLSPAAWPNPDRCGPPSCASAASTDTGGASLPDLSPAPARRSSMLRDPTSRMTSAGQSSRCDLRRYVRGCSPLPTWEARDGGGGDSSRAQPVARSTFGGGRSGAAIGVPSAPSRDPSCGRPSRGAAPRLAHDFSEPRIRSPAAGRQTLSHAHSAATLDDLAMDGTTPAGLTSRDLASISVGRRSPRHCSTRRTPSNSGRADFRWGGSAFKENFAPESEMEPAGLLTEFADSPKRSNSGVFYPRMKADARPSDYGIRSPREAMAGGSPRCRHSATHSWPAGLTQARSMSPRHFVAARTPRGGIAPVTSCFPASEGPRRALSPESAVPKALRGHAAALGGDIRSGSPRASSPRFSSPGRDRPLNNYYKERSRLRETAERSACLAAAIAAQRALARPSLTAVSPRQLLYRANSELSSQLKAMQALVYNT